MYIMDIYNFIRRHTLHRKKKTYKSTGTPPPLIPCSRTAQKVNSRVVEGPMIIL